MLSRRFKNRIPPATFFGTKPKKKSKTKEVSLIIVATFFLAPEAFARLSEQSAEAVFTRTYTKEDLSKTEPANPSKGLGDILKDHATALFTRLTQQQAGPNTKLLGFQDQVRELSDEEKMLRLDGFQKDDDRKLDGSGLTGYLRSQSQKAASEQLKESNSTLRKIKNGLALKLNLGEMLGFKSKEKEVASGTVRYGLLVKDIVPNNKSAIARAAISGSVPSDLKYAGHADVQWTIGPVYENEGRKVFNFSEQVGEEQEDGLMGIIKRLKVPSPIFNAKIEPGTADEAAAASSGAGGKARMPIKGTLAQEEGYYTFTYTSAGAKGVSQHDVRIPIVGEMAVGRRFDDKFDVVQSSVFNVLVDKRAPILSVHYLHLEDRVKTELVSEKPGQRISLETSHQRTNKDPATLPVEQRNNYTVKYTKDL